VTRGSHGLTDARTLITGATGGSVVRLHARVRSEARGLSSAAASKNRYTASPTS